LGYDADWIVQRTGIHERRHAPPEQATSDVGYEAASACLESAGISPAEIDLILVATMTPDYPMPSTACLIQERLGCLAPAMDLNVACAGFMFAMITGMQFVKTGCSRRVLVIGVDLMSRVVNPAGPAESDRGLLAYTLGAEGDAAKILSQPAGGTREPLTAEALAAGRQFIHMEGRAVFKWAVRVLIYSTRDALRHASLSAADIDLFVFHQANIRIIDAALSDLNIDREKVFVNFDRYGNTSAGSMPLILDEACRQGRLRRGDSVLLSGFGGGLAWGTAVMNW
jgi:3-oxoacyl-[acyl-carrier-protein] synthase-3